MTTFDVCFPCHLLSDQDRSRSQTVGPILTNPVLQHQLRDVHRILGGHTTTCGSEEHRRIRRVDYTALFGQDWELRIEVVLHLGKRGRGQSPDGDNLWKPVQNALGFPSVDMPVPGHKRGGHLFTLVAGDEQITEFAVRKAAYYPTAGHSDLVTVRVVALAPPHLRLTRFR